MERTSSRRSGEPVLCRYGSACRTPGCRFQHPPPAERPGTLERTSSRRSGEPVLCRYGSACRTPGCRFQHPQPVCSDQNCMDPSCKSAGERGKSFRCTVRFVQFPNISGTRQEHGGTVGIASEYRCENYSNATHYCFAFEREFRGNVCRNPHTPDFPGRIVYTCGKAS